MKALGDSHTAYDVMREYMIIGAELDGKYQIPMLDRYTGIREKIRLISRIVSV